MSGAIESQTSPADIINAAQQVEISALEARLTKLEDKTSVWGSAIDKLEGVFSAWQERLDAVLDNADMVLVNTGNELSIMSTHVDFFSILITVVVSVGVAYIAKKRKTIFDEAANKALKQFNEHLEKGWLPDGTSIKQKIINIILNSPEFKEKFQESYNKFKQKETEEIIEKFRNMNISEKPTKKTSEDD